jgi:5-methyltetrahydropteroyltriglutamate--homocysteine methyltransferase
LIWIACASARNCGFSSTHHGNKITVEDEIAKLRLIIEVADDVWG